MGMQVPHGPPSQEPAGFVHSHQGFQGHAIQPQHQHPQLAAHGFHHFERDGQATAASDPVQEQLEYYFSVENMKKPEVRHLVGLA